MKRTHLAIMVVIVVCALVIAALFFVIKKSAQHGSSMPTFTPLPEVTVKNLAGQEIAISSFRTKPLVLDLWASWCQPCMTQMSRLAVLKKEFGDKVIIGEVNRGESAEVVKKYMNQINGSQELMFFFDANDLLYQAIRGFLMPETLFVDKEGNVIYHTRGMRDSIDMRRRIEDLIGR